MLQEQCRSTNMQIHFKEGIIKEMRRKLRRTKFLYSNFFPYTSNRYDKVTIDNQEMESFYKLCEKIMIPKMMYTSAEHNNDSFLQTYINTILNHNKLIKDVSIMKTKHNNLKTKIINCHKNTEYNKIDMYKSFHDIDKKILKYSKKLPSVNTHKQLIVSNSCNN
ncbi:uncharacterized protein LOC132906020 [Bombus pascuorum]|uniref:uncharacterized protein LOC132906020 n=1 Tax=Bombus pascuorum TaxID=65598 RepID=UPI00298E915A|nr:uncharacterized protein LOC132906020 [Bombus pascuorum]